MSTPLVLILLSTGIAFTQALSSPRQVTLHWLRLGDLIALSLSALALAFALMAQEDSSSSAVVFAAALSLVGFIAHIVTVQLSRKTAQRAIIISLCILLTGILALPQIVPALLWPPLFQGANPTAEFFIALAIPMSAFLTGGSIMTMLLGHAYLSSAAQMTQQPFLRLTRALMVILTLRLLISLPTALWPWYAHTFGSDAPDIDQRFPINELALVAARYAAGLILPLILTWMTHQCVRIRSNQSATGILYVASTMMLIGELLALTYLARTGWPF